LQYDIYYAPPLGSGDYAAIAVRGRDIENPHELLEFYRTEGSRACGPLAARPRKRPLKGKQCHFSKFYRICGISVSLFADVVGLSSWP
jgi:hypothetical protein